MKNREMNFKMWDDCITAICELGIDEDTAIEITSKVTRILKMDFANPFEDESLMDAILELATR